MNAQPRCPYCLDDLLPDEERVRCAACRTPHHAECFQANDGCVSFGCQSSEDVASGMSVFVREELTLGAPARTTASLGPFGLAFRRVVSPHGRPTADPRALLLLETREVREGGSLMGRAVLSSSEPLTFRRLELVLYQGIGSPRRVGRVSLIKSPKGLLTQQTLPPGTHPFELELRAPPRTPPVDPFQLELRLVQGVFADLRSPPAPLYLLQGPPGPPLGAEPAQPPLPIVVQPRASQPDPHAWIDVPVHRAGSLYDSGEVTNRTVRVRFRSSPSAGEQLEIRVSQPAPTSPVPLQVEGGASLSMLNLAVHYELAGPDGAELPAPGFPLIEELFLLGQGCLDPLQFDRFTGLEVEFLVPPEQAAAVTEARTRGIDASLRLRLALDAIDVSGRVVPTRTTTLTLAD